MLYYWQWQPTLSLLKQFIRLKLYIELLPIVGALLEGLPRADIRGWRWKLDCAIGLECGRALDQRERDEIKVISLR